MKKQILLITMIFMPFSAWSLMPVVDIKSFFGLMKNFRALNHIREMAHQDMNALKSTLNGMNPLHLKSDLLSDHSWSPKTWDSALSGGEGSSLQSLMSRYKNQNQSITKRLSSNDITRHAVEQNLNIGGVLESSASAVYDQLSSHTHIVNRLSNQITVASTTKAALDLNNKLLAELAYLTIENLRMSALGNQAQSITLHNHLREASMDNYFLGKVEKQS